MTTQFDTKSALNNRRLKKDLRDGLADQKGVIAAKIAAKEVLTDKEAKVLRGMLRDRDGKLTAKIAAGLTASALAEAASFTGQVAGMTTDVTITAVTAGLVGNSVLLAFDGVEDIDAIVAAWNLANPSNTVSVTGDGSQIPDNGEEIALTNGTAAVLANLPDAKEKALLLSVLADQPRVLTDKIAAGESLED